MDSVISVAGAQREQLIDVEPFTIRPLPPRERSLRLAELAGGATALRAAAEAAQDASDHQWALELSDHLLRLDPDDEQARRLRVDALIALAERDSNPNARHYYLSSALEWRDGLRFAPVNTGSTEMLQTIPMAAMMDSLAVNLRAEEALDLDQKVGFTFTDTGEEWTVWIRRGVVESRPRLLDGLDIHARVEAIEFKRLLAGQSGAVGALARHFEFETGGAIALGRFLQKFRPDTEAPEPSL